MLSYAEEALQERAMFVPDFHGENITASGSSPQPPDPPKGEDSEAPRAPSTPAWTVMRMGEDQIEPCLGLAQSLKSPRDLWVVTKGRGWRGRPRHLVLKASWNLPMSEWTTACGWNFAQRSSDYYFVSGAVTDKLKCTKCDGLKKSATSQMGQEMRSESKEDQVMVETDKVSTRTKRRRT